MKYKALVSAHIFLDDENKGKDIEIFSQVDNDSNGTGIFDDIEDALLDQIEPAFDSSGSYFFMAVVESEFTKNYYPEGIEYDVEYSVNEIKYFEDAASLTQL